MCTSHFKQHQRLPSSPPINLHVTANQSLKGTNRGTERRATHRVRHRERVRHKERVRYSDTDRDRDRGMGRDKETDRNRQKDKVTKTWRSHINSIFRIATQLGKDSFCAHQHTSVNL